MTGWHRGDWFDSTGLPWVNPSPNIRNLDEALLYPGIAMLEYSTNYSVGRGTDAPFEQIGADWIRGSELARRLSELNIPGVRITPAQFTPASSNFGGKTITGVRFTVTDREAFLHYNSGWQWRRRFRSLYPKKIVFDVNRDLIGNSMVLRALGSGEDASVAANANLKGISGVAPEISALPLSKSRRRRKSDRLLHRSRVLCGGGRCFLPGRWLCSCFRQACRAFSLPPSMTAAAHDAGHALAPDVQASEIASSNFARRSWRNSSRIFETSIDQLLLPVPGFHFPSYSPFYIQNIRVQWQ